jgi:hypothetical protein
VINNTGGREKVNTVRNGFKPERKRLRDEDAKEIIPR